MEAAPKQNWWQRSWTFPASVLLHVLIVGVFYLQWPENMEAPAEPESVSVELVEPPKEQPPAEEQKAEEPPPPPPSPSVQQSLPNVAVRPDGTQLDERDEAGKQEEEGGAEQFMPNTAPETAKVEQPEPVEQPEAKPLEEIQSEVKPQTEAAEQPASALQASADTGEIAASEDPTQQELESVAIPLPRPETPVTTEIAQNNALAGADNPELKPARKLLASGERPRPMRRQILGELPPQARVAQLCIAETMAQIRDSKGNYTGLKPHTGISYPVNGDVMDAQGAFNVGNDWFPVDYRCKVDIDKYIVTDFRFNIGPQLSPEVVKRLNLHSG